MAKKRWKAFPYPSGPYEYRGDALAQHWSRLHRGDCEPLPNPASVDELVAHHPGLKPPATAAKAAAVLADAWRAYHGGDFGRAVELGLGVGPLGYNVANKAANIYGTYLESDDDARLKIFLGSAQRAEGLFGLAETVVNAWYLHAHALGRYGQGISVARALAEGLGGKVKSSLERAIKLERHHADAHIGLGTYHAEVIDKMGAVVGSLTYGVSKEAAIKHFETALKLNPHSAIARIEYGNALAMMFGKAKLERATALYAEAAACPPADAMERLDAELAKAELQD